MFQQNHSSTSFLSSSTIFYVETPSCSDMPQTAKTRPAQTYSLTRPSTGKAAAVTAGARATNWHMPPLRPVYSFIYGCSTRQLRRSFLQSHRQQALRFTHPGTDSTWQARASASATCCLLLPAAPAAIWSTAASESMAMLERASATLFSSLNKQHTQEEGVCSSRSQNPRGIGMPHSV